MAGSLHSQRIEQRKSRHERNSTSAGAATEMKRYRGRTTTAGKLSRGPVWFSRIGSALLWLGILSFLFCIRPCDSQSNSVAEYDVKAIFLYDFAKFVDWPSDSLANNKSPLLLCIMGVDPFGGMLDTIVRGQRINGHEIVIRRSNKTEDLKGCQIVFVSRAETKYLPIILDSLKGCSTLVVGEPEFRRARRRDPIVSGR